MGWNSGMDFITWAADMAWGNLDKAKQIELMTNIIKKTQGEDCDIQAEFLGKYPEYDQAYKRIFGEDYAYKQYALKGYKLCDKCNVVISWCICLSDEDKYGCD